MVRSPRDARGCATWFAIAPLLAAVACQRVDALPGEASDAGNDSQVPLGTSSTGEAGTTYDGPVPCERSEDCAGGFCVAPYDGGGVGMGAASCVPECVPVDALDRWCIDDTSCCASLQCNPVDGLCRASAGTDGTATDWGTTSLGDSDSGSGTSSSSSSSSSSSDSGATAGTAGSASTGA